MDTIKATLALLEGRTDQRQAEIDVSTQRATVARMAGKIQDDINHIHESAGGLDIFMKKLEIDVSKMNSVFTKAIDSMSKFSDPSSSEEWPVKSEKQAAEDIERARQLCDDLAERAEQLKALVSSSEDLLTLTSALFDLIELNKKLSPDSELLKK